MSNALDIPDLIVIIRLAVVTNGCGIVWTGWESHKRIVPIVTVRWVEIEGGLADVLSAVSKDEPVDCIVDIVCIGLDMFVVELNRRYCIISDMRDVSNWVVGVVKVLYDHRVGK